jgi:hypothetical protein
MLSCDIPDLWRESFSLSAINLMLAVKIELVNSEVFPPFLHSGRLCKGLEFVLLKH